MIKILSTALVVLLGSMTAPPVLHADIPPVWQFGVNPPSGAQFNAGYEAGWEEGYKHIKGEYALVPLCPLPPLPPIGKDTYQGGYNIGFLDGIARASKN